MATQSTQHDAQARQDSSERTRRQYVKYGSAVLGGGLFAGCIGQSGTESSGEGSYSVTMEPMGTVEFESVPETWLAFLSTYGDMGIALGQADGLRGLWNPDDVPDAFYDALPDVEISFDDVTSIEGADGFDKEIFYELDCDVQLLDPNWLGVLADNWEQRDREEIRDAVAPFLGNYIRRRGDDWHDYRYYSLYEAFEIVADAFQERSRYEALESAHEAMRSTVESTLPPAEERPTIGLLSVNSDFETGSFYAYPIQQGNNHTQYRDLEMDDAFDAHIDGSYANWDYEQLLDVDPDALVFQYGFSHVSAAEFEARMQTMQDDSTGKQLSAVQNDRLYRGGASYQGPIVNFFQTEAAARQFYPDAFGQWNGIETLETADLTLFDRQHVADVINGNF